MQAVCVHKPLAASGARAPRSSSSRVSVVRAAAASEQPEQLRLARRSLAGLLAAAPVLLSAGSALALIPDDDDEELVEKARANRQKRLASERKTEQAFSRSGNLNRVLEQELIPVQRAINGLAQSGAALEQGDVKAAADALSGSWVRDFKAAAEKLSYSDDAKATVATVLNNLSMLEAGAAGGSAAEAKRTFVATVGSLKAWASAANVAADLKGL